MSLGEFVLGAKSCCEGCLGLIGGECVYPAEQEGPDIQDVDSPYFYSSFLPSPHQPQPCS